MILITIEQIHYFLAIYKYNNFSLAAHELCISQSSLSKQIKALEAELDTMLFSRSSRAIQLTAAGEDFYHYAVHFLKNYNDILQGMKKHSLSKQKTINVGAIAVITQYGLTSLLANFKNRYPHIMLNIIEEENDMVLSLLIKSSIDFAIMRDFNLPHETLDIHTLAKDQLVVVTGKDHPFSQKESITLSDLKNEELIICSRSGIYERYMTECNKLGFCPRVTHSIHKIETILGLVAEGFGITIIPSNVLKPFSNLNVCTHLLAKPIASNLVLVTHSNGHPQKDFLLFKNFILEHLSSPKDFIEKPIPKGPLK